MGPSIRKSPPRYINWLFFNPVNEKSRIRSLVSPGYPADIPLDQLGWVAAFKDGFRFQADTSTMEFWVPSIPLFSEHVGPGWLKDHPAIDEVAHICQASTPVGTLLKESWEPIHVHFLVIARELGDTDPGEDEGNHVPELPLHAMHSRLRGRERTLPAPSTAATSREHARLQKDSKTAVYNGFYARKRSQHLTVVTTAPPIQVFHPVFQEFLDRINDPNFKPEKKTIAAVSELLLLTSEIRSSESDAPDELRPLLRKLLDTYVGKESSAGSRTTDGVAFKMVGAYRIPLLCLEYKRALGEGGCDPSTQAAYSLREFLILDEIKMIFERCCCPSFILAGGGPHLSILGVVYTDKLIVQQLTEVWAGAATVHRNAQIYRIAQIFESLRLAIATLDRYYGEISNAQDIPSLVVNDPHPRFFPYPTKFKQYTANTGSGLERKFKYIDIPSAASTNVTFIAKDDSKPPEKLVIKFVEQYGVKAHELLAREEMAPQLLYCGLLDGEHDVRQDGSGAQGEIKSSGLYVGPVLMVVMKHVEGSTMDKEPALLKDSHEQIKKMIKKLHGAGYVFGDLRAPNIMISKGKAFFIDFDWAGKEQEVRYPLCLSRKVKWPAGVKELELITREHDMFMLNQLLTE